MTNDLTDTTPWYRPTWAQMMRRRRQVKANRARLKALGVPSGLVGRGAKFVTPDMTDEQAVRTVINRDNYGVFGWTWKASVWAMLVAIAGLLVIALAPLPGATVLVAIGLTCFLVAVVGTAASRAERR